MDLDNYVKVNERIAEFRETYKEGFITTFRGDAKDGIAFKAVVFRNAEELAHYATCDIAPATGHSFLHDDARGDDKVEEYTETVAVGRALAILGFKVEKAIASAEEMEQFQNTKTTESDKDDVKLDNRFRSKT